MNPALADALRGERRSGGEDLHAGAVARPERPHQSVSDTVRPIANAAWAHTLGVFCLFAFIVVAFPASLPPDLLPAPIKNHGAQETDPR
jgi:hypothetical protein